MRHRTRLDLHPDDHHWGEAALVSLTILMVPLELITQVAPTGRSTSRTVAPQVNYGISRPPDES